MRQFIIIALCAFILVGEAVAQDVMVTPDLLRQKTKELEEARRGKPQDPNAPAPRESQNEQAQPPAQNASTEAPQNPTPAAQQNQPAEQQQAQPTQPAQVPQQQPTTAPANTQAQPAPSQVPGTLATPAGAAASQNSEPAKSAAENAAQTTNNLISDVEKKFSNLEKSEVVIKTEHDILAPANWQGSLMFDLNDLKVIKTAREVYMKTKGQGGPSDQGHDGLKLSDSEMQAVNQPRQIETPIILLGSIAFFDKNNWSIWINGDKYTKNDTPQGLEILGVNKEYVSLAWNSEYLDLVIPEWKNISTEIGDEKRVIKRGNSKIVVDGATGRVTFTLFPNQTFIGKNLDIVEGKVSNSTTDYVQVVVPTAQAGRAGGVFNGGDNTQKMLQEITPQPEKKAQQ